MKTFNELSEDLGSRLLKRKSLDQETIKAHHDEIDKDGWVKLSTHKASHKIITHVMKPRYKYKRVNDKLVKQPNWADFGTVRSYRNHKGEIEHTLELD